MDVTMLVFSGFHSLNAFTIACTNYALECWVSFPGCVCVILVISQTTVFLIYLL